MGARAGISVLEEQTGRWPSRSSAVLAIVTIVAGTVFGVLLAGPLDVSSWLAALLAAAYAGVVAVAGWLLIQLPPPQ